ncbi:uncharacterized protein [Procambarus clarkii]|uniref:uncharacterized protein isoform X1 n=2 Tax=Procambarus clarkii TaxID=6728 RepID=UPI00374210E7
MDVESVCTTQITYSVTESVLEAVENGTLVKTFVEHQEYYRCIVCNRTMSGIVPAQSHLEGSPHRKAIRTHMYSSVLGASKRGSDLSFDRLDSTSQCMPATSYQSPSLVRKENTSVSSLKPVTQHETDLLEVAMKRGIVEVRMVNEQTFIFCCLCNISCTSDANMTQHLEGEPHCKKQRMTFAKDPSTEVAIPKKTPASLYYSTSPSMLSYSSNPEKELDFLKCDNYSPPKDLVESAIEDGIVTKAEGIDSSLICTVCKTPCTGETPMKQHLQGSSHLKKMRSGWHRRVEDLSSYPGNTSQEQSALKLPKSQDNTSPSRDILDSALENGIVVREKFDPSHLTCTICGSTCTGETPTRQHLKGITHMKKLRAKGYAHQSTACATPAKNIANWCEKKDCTSISQSFDTSQGLLESAMADGCVIRVNGGYQCLVCCVPCNSVTSISDHLTGDQHHRKLRDQKNYDQFKTSAGQINGRRSVSPPEYLATTSSSTVTPAPQEEKFAFKSDVNKASTSESMTGCSFKNIDSLRTSFIKLPETLSDIKVYLAGNTLDDLFN